MVSINSGHVFYSEDFDDFEVELINDLETGTVISTPSNADGAFQFSSSSYEVMLLFLVSMVFGAILGKGFFK